MVSDRERLMASSLALHFDCFTIMFSSLRRRRRFLLTFLIVEFARFLFSFQFTSFPVLFHEFWGFCFFFLFLVSFLLPVE